MKERQFDNSSILRVSNYRGLARAKLSKEVFDYIDGAACDEITKKQNRLAYDNTSIKPNCLHDVTTVDTSSHLFDVTLRTPIFIAPVSMQQMVDAQGELATAKAAAHCGTPMIVSLMSNYSLEAVADASKNNLLWMQLYLFKSRQITESIVRRAEQAGYQALVLTVGVPCFGIRERVKSPSFYLSLGLNIDNLSLAPQKLTEFLAEEIDPSITWNDVKWLQSITKLPILLKGILNAGDAEKACSLNLSGLIVSNHGGRQLDTSASTLSVLPEIAAVVGGRMKILIDGGIERGTDILKAIALGADGVLIGRPVMWALAVGGHEELIHMLNLLKNELEITMKLAGCKSIRDIKDFTNNLGLFSTALTMPL